MPGNRAALIIGINKVKGLIQLQAAVSGARDMVAWATDQGMTVKLLVDDSNPVTIAMVKQAVKDIMQENLEHLLIYFAGHGILKSPDNEHWLLSRAGEDGNEAIAVSLIKSNAVSAGISHVVIMSDCCRSMSDNMKFAPVQGGTIFPTMNIRMLGIDVDVFYATAPGDFAYEVPEKNGNTILYNSLYLEHLLKALQGKVPSLLSPDRTTQNCQLVLSHNLRKYLENEVPTAAAQRGLPSIQQPIGQPASIAPKYLSRILRSSIADQPDDETLAWEADAIPKKGRKNRSWNIPKDKAGRTGYGLEKKNVPEIFLQSVDPEISGTGFLITGVEDCSIIVDHGKAKIKKVDAGMLAEVKVTPGTRTALLVIKGEFEFGIPLAVLQGFTGRVQIHKDRVLNLSYIPSVDNPKYEQYRSYRDKVEMPRAAVAAYMRNGEFIINAPGSEINRLAGYFRHEKALDPTLGLFAAYAYAQKNDFDSAYDVFKFMSQEREPVLFDVALLALDVINPEYNDHNINYTTAPFCPVLTQGWNFWNMNEDRKEDAYSFLSKCLLPSMWTTFNQKGINYIIENIFKNEKTDLDTWEIAAG